MRQPQIPFKPSMAHETSVALIPPDSAWPPIQNARMLVQDRGLWRWPPHVNLLYPFVALTEFEVTSLSKEEGGSLLGLVKSLSHPHLSICSSSSSSACAQSAAAELAKAAASVEPFDVLLRDFHVFVHKKSATLWLHPEPSRSEALQKLQAALQDAMPLCDAQRSSHGTFTPHVTVGHFESEEAALSARNQIIASGWQGVEFPVSEVVLMARSEGGGGQFEPRWRVRLGRSAGLAAAAAHGERFGLMPTEMPAFCEREPCSKKD